MNQKINNSIQYIEDILMSNIFCRQLNEEEIYQLKYILEVLKEIKEGYEQSDG